MDPERFLVEIKYIVVELKKHDYIYDSKNQEKYLGDRHRLRSLQDTQDSWTHESARDIMLSEKE